MDRHSPNPVAEYGKGYEDEDKEGSPSKAADAPPQTKAERQDKEDGCKEEENVNRPLGGSAGDSLAFPQTAKEIVRFWWQHFPAGVRLHLHSSSFRINAVVIALLLVCDPKANLLFVWLYGVALFLSLSIGIYGFCMSPRWRQQGHPVRSSRETDELGAHITGRLGRHRLPIAILGAVLLLPDWQAVHETLGAQGKLIEVAGVLLATIAVTQALVTVTHPLSWQKLFGSQTAAFTGGRS